MIQTTVPPIKNYPKDLQDACARAGKWGMYISFPELPMKTLLRLAPYLGQLGTSEVFKQGYALFLAPSREELNRLYYQTMGEDGLPGRPMPKPDETVYAMIIDPKGVIKTDNT